MSKENEKEIKPHEHSELLYSSHFLPGRGTRIGGCRIGIVHGVPSAHGDNFNRAICGKKPSGISLGWSTTSLRIACPKCKKELKI